MLRLSSTFGTLLFGFSACGPACTPPAAKEPEPAPGPGANPTGAAAAPTGAAAQPSAMVMEAKGVDLGRLTDAQRTAFFQTLNVEPSACGKPHSLAVSLRDDASCRDSLIVAQFTADALGAGATASDVKDQIQLVRDALRPREIPVAGRPTLGNVNAPVTVVVFADFECPHCRAEFPKVRQSVERFHGRAKLVFKHFPLGGHPRAKDAAIATEAAHEQGKFWEMASIVFENQTRLADEDLKAYAKQIGLDLGRFEASYRDKRGAAAVDQDRVDGEKIDLQGTPAVFVNGRYYTEALFGGTVEGWIDDALRR